MSTASSSSVAGLHHPAETHLLDTAEEWQLAGEAGVREHGDRARLRERLELEHPREDRIPGEVTGEERLVAGHSVASPDPHRGFALVDLVHEQERRAVRQQGDERAPIVGHAGRHYFAVAPLLAGTDGYRPVRNGSFIHHVSTGHTGV